MNPSESRTQSRRRPARSPSATASPITFTPASLSVDSPKGVQDITRKVIRQLEGLGHLEPMTTPYADNDESDAAEVESTVVSANSTRRSSFSSNGHTLSNGHSNGAAKVVENPVDYEIPRKLLHSSIGACTAVLYFTFCHSYTGLAGFLTFYLYAGEGDAKKVVIALWSALCIIYPADLLRFRSRRFAKLYESLLGFLMREEERVRSATPHYNLYLTPSHRTRSTASYGTSSASTSSSNVCPLTWPPYPS